MTRNNIVKASSNFSPAIHSISTPMDFNAYSGSLSKLSDLASSEVDTTNELTLSAVSSNTEIANRGIDSVDKVIDIGNALIADQSIPPESRVQVYETIASLVKESTDLASKTEVVNSETVKTNLKRIVRAGVGVICVGAVAFGTFLIARGHDSVNEKDEYIES